MKTGPKEQVRHLFWLTDFIKAGRWEPAEAAQAEMIKEFKKKYGIKDEKK
jgi:hypothetical protein